MDVIDEPTTKLHRVLKDRAILSAARVLRRRGWMDEANLRDELDHAGLPPTTVAYLRGVQWEELRAAVEQLLDQAEDRLAGADLHATNLAGADLHATNLAGAHLAGADLSCARLTRANLAGADLSGADLKNASLYGTRRPSSSWPSGA